MTDREGTFFFIGFIMGGTMVTLIIIGLLFNTL